VRAAANAPPQAPQSFPPTRAKSMQIESRFRSKYLFGRMILSEKSATFRDHALGSLRPFSFGL
jgi:hypothetical protein